MCTHFVVTKGMKLMADTYIKYNDHSISSAFKDHYIVPDYQREYVWTDEQVEHIDDPEPPTPPKDLTKEEQEERKKKKQAKEARKKAIDILRGVSIRMPLMIYGADVPIEEDIDINSFVDIIDDESWKEFMPTGVSKKIFTEFTKYYDRDVFIAAGKRIRRLAAAADRETPTRRVIQIAEIFRHFKNHV